MKHAGMDYKAEFLKQQRMAQAYEMPRINSDPALAQKFYEALGRTTAYEYIFHGLGQSKFLQGLQEEIKKELGS
jgi:hypothetical protein